VKSLSPFICYIPSIIRWVFRITNTPPLGGNCITLKQVSLKPQGYICCMCPASWEDILQAALVDRGSQLVSFLIDLFHVSGHSDTFFLLVLLIFLLNASFPFMLPCTPIYLFEKKKITLWKQSDIVRLFFKIEIRFVETI
jgi:hypothetical protein